ncbi:ead/Ea22-like family protein [Enterobacter ludwigii]|uniref:ead/Ea22-like family protein n=1 Tax=Enterobacter ludwigii TaxID=299767 RepID=UPI0022E24F05|nr:ead/Ea22-like family protein [Enterobacter ludwigii]
MSNIDKQALRQTAEKAQEHGVFNMDIHSQTVLALLDELEAKDKQIADLKEAFRIALSAAGIDVPTAAGKGE